MGRSTVHYADSETNNILKRLHNKLRPAGTPVERVEYIIELLLLRIFEAKIKQDEIFIPLRKLFEGENYRLLFSYLLSLNGEQILSELNKNIFPFYSNILSKVRMVISGNLPQKIQDQLVLMEEVFSNSNFTNNVKGGVIAEVIGMVNDIDEKYILKTDLLGDAIESALSETGGTKDLGLYRTPDHIRQMMVEMVNPDFSDIIFDPACGTAGFLFDAYDYIIEKARKTRQFPAENIANMFYRTGIGGIEYQGRIRKMAAVNMYIRGLNPHNIDQGDSLKMFDPSHDAGSKSVVISNPPFGAERDQPAYPNIWEEYSKESETTILFVKLMFDLLKTNGRCAVIISEGFLTWGQNSACALRKILLNESNLRAIISLPQGVFVSKSGQGAKTSILYFEKGQPTDFIWYYKIENDGFSMGTNRKPIEGSQIPELLELFKDVKQGRNPQDTKNSFCISKEQIETLDPRIVERIKKEVTEKTKERNSKKRKKLVTDLNKKLESKKINQEIHDEKLWQFDNIVEGKIDNEVAKALEKAHSYHFNLQNYSSNLSGEQIKEWQETLKDIKPKNGSKIERKYQELQKDDPKTALQILASFDPKDALQMDITKEYLSKLDKNILEQNERLVKLFEILKETKQFPFEKLKNLLTPKSNKISLDDETVYKQVTIKLYGKGILLRQEILGADIKTEGQYLVNEGDFIMSKIDARNGAFGIVPNYLDGAVVTSSFPYFDIQKDKVNPKYLEVIVTKKSFYDQINNMVSGATGRRSVEVNDFLELPIPLPPLEAQNEIVEKIEKQKQIIESVKRIEENWDITDDNFVYGEIVDLGNYLNFVSSGSTPLGGESNYIQDGILFIRSQNVLKGKCDFSNAVNIPKEIHNKMQRTHLYKNDVLLNITGASIGRSAVFNLDIEANVNQHVSILRVKDGLLPEYLSFLLNTPDLQKQIDSLQNGASRQGLNFNQIKKLKIPLPTIEVQRQIVEKLDQQMQALGSVQLLKSVAEKRIEEILSEVWGEKLL